MNPLKSIWGTIISGIVLSVIIIFALGPSGTVNPWEFWVWAHVLVGITWIGLLYYFNFVQVPGVAKALAEAEGGGPGPAAINKYIAPTALLWFRWAALAKSRWPELVLLHAIPNGGHRHKAVAVRMKAEGMKAGVPDICLPVPRGSWHGLYLELKTEDGSVSRAQRRWLEQHACHQAVELAAAYRLIPRILDKARLEAARVEARLRRSAVRD